MMVVTYNLTRWVPLNTMIVDAVNFPSHGDLSPCPGCILTPGETLTANTATNIDMAG